MEHPVTPENTQVLQEIMQHTIYLMGFSFILGVLATVSILWVLDFVRRNKPEGAE